MRRWYPEIAIALVVLIWSTTWIAMKDALTVFDPLAFMTSRFVMITLLAWVVILIRRARYQSLAVDRADWPRLTAGAAVGYSGYQLFGVFALDKSSVFTIALLVALVPLFTMIMMAAMGESLPAFGWLGLAIAVAGTVIFLIDKRQAGDSLLGALLSLAAAVCFAAYGLINRPLVSRYPSEILAGWQLLIGTIPMVVIGGLSVLDQPWADLTPRIWIRACVRNYFPGVCCLPTLELRNLQTGSSDSVELRAPGSNSECGNGGGCVRRTDYPSESVWSISGDCGTTAVASAWGMATAHVAAGTIASASGRSDHAGAGIVSGFIGFAVGLLGMLLFLGAGLPLASRRVAASSAFGLRSADTDGDEQVWYLANAALGRVLVWTAGICAILAIVSLAYWGDEPVQSALVVAILMLGLAGAIAAIAIGLTTARALGKAKQAFPPGMRRF